MICIKNIFALDIYTELYLYSGRSDNHVKKWCRKALKEHILLTKAYLKAVDNDPSEIRSDYEIQAIEAGEQVYLFVRGSFKDDIENVLYWATELEELDPQQYSTLATITFPEALKASSEWRNNRAKEAAILNEKGIPKDPINAPEVLSAHNVGEGWKWVWLKTPEARRLEGVAFGNRLGCKLNESFRCKRDDYGTFSLRDGNEIAFITLTLGAKISSNKDLIVKEDVQFTDEMKLAVEQARQRLGLRLWLAQELGGAVADGDYHRKEYTYRIVDEQIHRTDGPAVTWAKGQAWMVHDGHHRVDGPALVEEGYRKEWWIDGLRHREGEPAVMFDDGSEQWWLNGVRHRENGPAVTSVKDKKKEWWLNGKRHREGAPAVEGDGYEQWFLNGVWHREDGPASISPNGDTRWYLNGVLHREDGPALIHKGAECWYLNGKRVRSEDDNKRPREIDPEQVRKYFLEISPTEPEPEMLSRRRSDQ